MDAPGDLVQAHAAAHRWRHVSAAPRPPRAAQLGCGRAHVRLHGRAVHCVAGWQERRVNGSEFVYGTLLASFFRRPRLDPRGRPRRVFPSECQGRGSLNAALLVGSAAVASVAVPRPHFCRVLLSEGPPALGAGAQPRRLFASVCAVCSSGCGLPRVAAVAPGGDKGSAVADGAADPEDRECVTEAHREWCQWWRRR